MARMLTVRQQQVYDYILDRVSARGYGPTVREIGEFLGIRSPNGVMCHLRALESKGMISRLANKSRAIEITNRVPGAPNDNPVPRSNAFAVRGCVSQGECKLFDAPKPFDVLAALHRLERYWLEYSGNDLREFAIDDGDMLLVEPHRADRKREDHAEGLKLVQNSSGTIQLKIPGESSATDETGQLVGCVVGVLRMHRPGSTVKPPHLLLRTAQRA